MAISPCVIPANAQRAGYRRKTITGILLNDGGHHSAWIWYGREPVLLRFPGANVEGNGMTNVILSN
ncbi:MAG: hypothetical protein JSR65_12350 [Proteobacteria bacterium]|nr:hypothetical protein [Pseudomonadota bacterium]